MGNRSIFVSCGQCTKEEKDLGLAIKGAIDQIPGLEAYFAEAVHSLEALGRHVFEGLRQCVGAVVVLHPRGRVVQPDGAEWGTRSSVWVNQEMAILAFRQLSERRALPIIVFADSAVNLEGAMTSIIVNPLPLGAAREVIEAVKHWLRTSNFSTISDEVIQDSWNRLSEPSRKVLASLLGAGGTNVSQLVLQRTLIRNFSISQEEVGRHINEAHLEFVSTGLVTRQLSDDGYVFSVCSDWEIPIRRKVEEWSAAQLSAGAETSNPGLNRTDTALSRGPAG